MASTSKRQKGRDGVLLALDVFIQGLNLAKDTCGIPPAQAAFGSASILLTAICDTMANERDYVELGRTCGDVCQVLYRRLKGKRLDGLNQSVLDAIGDLTTTVAGMEREVVKQGKRNPVSRFILSKGDKGKIAAWKQDLVRVLHVFNTELAIDTNIVVTETKTEVVDTRVVVTDTHAMVAEIHQSVLAGQEGTSGTNRSTQASIPLGELPPPAPRTCFGRDGLIENVVGLAEMLKPIALIGAGGIGKTSIALTVLHHDRIEQRFGENRRFIRCDQFPASRAHFLARLSKVIGAGVESPEDLTPLRFLLSSKEMLIVLDNAESVLDPQGTNAEEIYSVVDELCRFKKLCVCITSRITTVPPQCKRPEIPTLSMEAACDIFYGIYGNGDRSRVIDDLLERLDFHALSITLLATTASHNMWNYDRLAKEWDSQRAQVLQAGYNKSLAATIELSLASLTFLSLGPDARDLLAAVAFLPQGIDERNLDWLFSTISNRKNIFDKFCVLSLTYRSNDFITMLAPIRDYLGPQDPQSSPLLCATRDRYFDRLSVDLDPDKPGFKEGRWIVLEDVNVEHMLSVFISIDQSGGAIWRVCFRFIEHLRQYKPRQTTLGSKIEALADDHHCKAECLFKFSQLLQVVGNHARRERLLTCVLELVRRRRDEFWVARVLHDLSVVNRQLNRREEGIRQAKEALEFFERLGHREEQASCLTSLAWLFLDNKQLEAAENAASRAIGLVGPEKGQEFSVCQLHRVLGSIYRSGGEKRKAIYHLEMAIRIASPPNWHEQLFWIHHSLAMLFIDEDELGDATVHIERAKSYALDYPYHLCRLMHLQSIIWYLQHRFEEAKSEALHALEITEKLGAAKEAGAYNDLLQRIEQAIEAQSTGLQV